MRRRMKTIRLNLYAVKKNKIIEPVHSNDMRVFFKKILFARARPINSSGQQHTSNGSEDQQQQSTDAKSRKPNTVAVCRARCGCARMCRRLGSGAAARRLWWWRWRLRWQDGGRRGRAARQRGHRWSARASRRLSVGPPSPPDVVACGATAAVVTATAAAGDEDPIAAAVFSPSSCRRLFIVIHWLLLLFLLLLFLLLRRPRRLLLRFVIFFTPFRYRFFPLPN